MRSLKSHKCHDGRIEFWEHESRETKTTMKFSTFIPEEETLGCLIWLSGLTCTEENFMVKAGAQKSLAEAKLMVICPDTSPRGLNLPSEHDSWDFGSGAGFYVDSRTAGYADHYRMYSYVTKELYDLVQGKFELNRISIMGHSMGGHGALIMALNEPQKFLSVSAFAPVVNPMRCPWGAKAFKGYLGEDQADWTSYDSCELLNAGMKHPSKILIHQGSKDEFLGEQLQTENFAAAARRAGQDHAIKYAEGYDHGYYFVTTFIDEHIRHHARIMNSKIISGG